MRWEFDSAAIEFRSLQEYTNKDGKVTITIIVEDDQANQNRIRCNDSSRFTELGKLQKGERYSFPIVVRDGNWDGKTFISCELAKRPIQHYVEDLEEFVIV